MADCASGSFALNGLLDRARKLEGACATGQTWI